MGPGRADRTFRGGGEVRRQGVGDTRTASRDLPGVCLEVSRIRKIRNGTDGPSPVTRGAEGNGTGRVKDVLTRL